jgi:xylan 1,4-beta-xylosidase
VATSLTLAVFVLAAAMEPARAVAAGPTSLLPTAAEKAVTWKYCLDRPADGWQHDDFADATWSRGLAGFGSEATPGAVVGTRWNTPDIWLRTRFTYGGAPFLRAALVVHHDEDVTIYLNGEKILQESGYLVDYESRDATAALRKALRRGINVLAVTCHQTSGGQFIDVGIVLDPAGPATRPALAPLKPLFDYPLRDPSICIGGDGAYYLTGTTGFPTWWKTNEGIRIWKSPDLVQWRPLGLVWKIEQGTWQKEFHGDQRALWAPEIHFLKGTYWLTYSMNFGGCGLLKSTSGKAEGPYVDVHPAGPLTGDIDASLTEDSGGHVYFVWQNGMIARLADDMASLAEKPRHLVPSNYRQVGFEGAFLKRIGGRYYLLCAEFNRGNYDCMAASAESIYGPYGPRYLAIPHGGHNMIFQDKSGQWWSTLFGSDPRAPVQERPAILKIEWDKENRLRPVAP